MKPAWLEMVSPPADRLPGHPEQCQDRADHDHDDADRPEDGYFGDEANDEENYAENNQGGS